MSQSPSARIARTSDHDRWLCALFAEPEPREAIFSLLAFNAEIAKIRETVSEPILGDIRLKWWDETLARLYEGAGSENPVAAALSDTIIQYDLPAALFDDMLKGRALDLDEAQPALTADLAKYVDLTGGALQALISQVLGTDMARSRALGSAWALLGVLRAIPFHYRQGLVLLPAASLNKEGLTRASFLAPENQGKLARVIADMAGLVESRLSDLAQGEDFSHSEKSLFILARMYLRKLQRHGYDLHGMDWEISAWRRAGRLWFASVTGR